MKIPRIKVKGEMTKAFFWVEYRKPSTLYEKLGAGGNFKTDGAIVRYVNPDQPSPTGWSWPNETLLLNFLPPGNPESIIADDFVLRGEWKDPYSLVHLKVLEATPEKLKIKITFE